MKDLSLDLFGNKLGDDGVESISKASLETPRFETFSCKKNMTHQCKALPKSLEKLHLVLQDNDLSRRHVVGTQVYTSIYKYIQVYTSIYK